MHFRESQPIYLQIATYVCERILTKEWKVGERIPAVRELAVLLEVNPNTIMRSYDFLQQQGIIINERGIGLFVSDKAIKNVITYLQTEFVEKEMAYFFRSMILLDMELDELTPYFEKYKKKHFPNLSKKVL